MNRNIHTFILVLEEKIKWRSKKTKKNEMKNGFYSSTYILNIYHTQDTSESIEVVKVTTNESLVFAVILSASYQCIMLCTDSVHNADNEHPNQVQLCELLFISCVVRNCAHLSIFLFFHLCCRWLLLFS